MPVATQFEKDRALSVPENAVHRERDGEADAKSFSFVAVALVAAARSWGGQSFVFSRTKWSHSRPGIRAWIT